MYGYQAVNVEAQTRDRSSLLNWMKRILQVRRASQAFGRGTLRFIRPGNRNVLAYLRQYGGDTILCVANLARSAQPVELDLGEHKGSVPIELLGRSAFPPIGELPYLLTLPGYGFYWFRLSREAQAPPWHDERQPREDAAGAGPRAGLEQLLPRARSGHPQRTRQGAAGAPGERGGTGVPRHTALGTAARGVRRRGRRRARGPEPGRAARLRAAAGGSRALAPGYLRGGRGTTARLLLRATRARFRRRRRGPQPPAAARIPCAGAPARHSRPAGRRQRGRGFLPPADRHDRRHARAADRARTTARSCARELRHPARERGSSPSGRPAPRVATRP